MREKIVLCLISFLVGGVSVWGFERFQRTKASTHSIVERSILRDPFFDDLFKQDPFEQFNRMQSQMFNQFEPAIASTEMSQTEDDKYINLNIDLQGLKPKNLNIEVKNGQVSINGELEQNNQSDHSSSYFSSSFHRSFPAPDGVDAANYSVEQKEGKIIVKFPKIKT